MIQIVQGHFFSTEKRLRPRSLINTWGRFEKNWSQAKEGESAFFWMNNSLLLAIEYYVR